MRFMRVTLVVPVADDERDADEWDWEKLLRTPERVCVEEWETLAPVDAAEAYQEAGFANTALWIERENKEK